jgi:hypothetical protein
LSGNFQIDSGFPRKELTDYGQSTVDVKHDLSTKYWHLLLAQIVASDFATIEILSCGGGGANAMPSSKQLGS